MSNIHDNFYDYSLIKEYKNADDLFEIICPVHGKFEQSLYNHAKKHGCKQCSTDKYRDKYFEQHRLSFIDKFQNKFLDKLEIVGEYISNSTRIQYRCNNCSIIYSNTPNKLLSKGNRGCAYCYGNGKHKQNLQFFEKYKEMLVKEVGFLYVVRLYNETENFIKIGITKEESCETRYQKIPYEKEIVFLQENSMYNCFKIEQIVLKEYKNCKYKPSIWFGGASECFSLSCYLELEPLVKLLMAESLNQI